MDPLFKCKYCEVRQHSKSSLNEHRKNDHPETYKIICHQCGLQFGDRSAYCKHNSQIHKNIKFTCGQCDYKGTTKHNLDKHIESAHNNVTFQCETCSKPFKYATNLQKHKRNNEKCSN